MVQKRTQITQKEMELLNNSIRVVLREHHRFWIGSASLLFDIWRSARLEDVDYNHFTNLVNSYLDELIESGRLEVKRVAENLVYYRLVDLLDQLSDIDCSEVIR